MNTIISPRNSIIDLEFSEIIIEKLLIENITMENYLIISNRNTFCNLKATLFTSKNLTIRKIENNFYSVFIKASSSFLILEQLYLNHFKIENFFTLIFVRSVDNLDLEFSNIYFQNCKLINISATINDFHILKSEQEIHEFSLKNSLLKLLTSKTNLFFFTQVNSIALENTIFSENFLESNVYIKSSSSIFMKNVTCFSNNKRNKNFNSYGGSCFKFYGGIHILLQRLHIINSVSSISAIMIIEGQTEKQKIKSKLLIYQAIFSFNAIETNTSHQENGGTCRIITKTEIIIEKFICRLNKLNQKANDILAYAPCFEIISSISVSINDSFFQQNKASKFSNCIYCLSDLMNVTYSFFLNNSIFFLTERDYNFLNVTTKPGEEYFDVDDSKGGGIFFSGNHLFVSHTYFLDNKANKGSAIFIDDPSITKKVFAIILINSSFFIHNQALLSSVIHLNFFFYFEIAILNSYLYYNLAYDGGVMLFKMSSNGKVTLISNCIVGNIAAWGPVIYIIAAPILIFSSNNLYLSNEARAKTAKLGGAVYTSLSDAILYLENEIYYENIGFQGVNVFLSSKAFEVNSIYIKNSAPLVSCIATGNSALYVGNKVSFLLNFAEKFGCVCSLDTSFIQIESSLFYNLTSTQRSACVIIWDRTNLTIVNSLFTMNKFNLIEIDSSPESKLLNCSFLKNSAPKNFLDAIRSNLLIEKTLFANNNGTFLSLSANSLLVLKLLFFKNILCKENLIFLDSGLMKIFDSYFSEIQLKGSLFHIVYSHFTCSNNLVSYISVEKSGAYVKAELSNVFVYGLYMFEIPSNVLYLEKSYFEAVKGYYIFKNVRKRAWRENFGVIQAEGSIGISIRGFRFEGYRENLILNRFLYFVNCQTMINISESYFRYGFSMIDGGMGYFIESNVTFWGCLFKNNFGRRGGAIFFNAKKGRIF